MPHRMRCSPSYPARPSLLISKKSHDVPTDLKTSDLFSVDIRLMTSISQACRFYNPRRGACARVVRAHTYAVGT